MKLLLNIMNHPLNYPKTQYVFLKQYFFVQKYDITNPIHIQDQTMYTLSQHQ